ncbi:Uncharacterised protein [Dorea longicatena]|nr:Uncharacterised protein [Dorea longicatena]
MFATQCSKPPTTNAHIGKKIAHTFPAISLAEVAIKTARQTRILHKIPDVIP